ncbi:MAG TPA: hypothetical protein VKR42_05845, partial [Ktedonobacteraceae bacterium]|nr:hypothetical protein [Ktedonobacteraceae bacterium]
IALILLLGLAFLFIIGQHGKNTNVASGGGPNPTSTPGYGSLNHPKGPCGNAGQTPCAAPDPDWFPVVSESPNTVASAITGSSSFAAIASQYGCASLDAPTLVHSYNAHTGVAYYDDDHWVVSVRDNTGMRCGIFDFVYDRTNRRMRFSSYGVLTAQDPHSRLAFPYISSQTALAQLQSQRGLGIQSGTQPALIFFPIDPSFPYLNSPAHKWAGGGNSALNPIWHLVGTDGRDYFLGVNLKVYTQQDLPIAQGQP